MKRSILSSASQVGNNATRSSPSSQCSGRSSNAGSNVYTSSNSASTSSQRRSPVYIKRVQRKIREAGQTISSNSSNSSCSNVFGASSTLTNLAGSCFSQQSALPRAALDMSENNSTTPASGGRCSKKDACGSGAIYAAKDARRTRPKAAAAAAAAGKSPNAVVNLMGRCAGATAEQAERMRVAKKGEGCLRENPYSALRTETFRRLLQRTGGRRRRMRTGGTAGGGRKRLRMKWCKPKVDECEAMQTQLCPNLGAGHTHEKLLDEVTPLLLRSAQSLNCQLKELCRRLFFMRHNVPQLTAPALVNFHGILAEICRMLVADFSSFSDGLRLPDRHKAK